MVFMSDFKDIINGSEESLLQLFYKFRDNNSGPGSRLTNIATKLRLRPEQLLCAVGFNPCTRYLTEIFPILGYSTFDELCQERNEVFATDIYKRLTLDNILSIYGVVKDDMSTLDVMQYLLKRRLEKIEGRIESTVNSLIIEKYKAEMRAIYNDGVAKIDFAEERLNTTDNGFRALLNEVAIIIESKLIPAGDIFFRDTILPEEKRKILDKGLIPRDLIQSRLDAGNLSADEKRVLNEYLKQIRE